MRQRFSMRFLQPEAVAAGPEAWHLDLTYLVAHRQESFNPLV
jgi:hypothetical protein